MGKLSEDYKRKYLLLEVSDKKEYKKEKNIIIDALKDYIEKCTEDIKAYSKSLVVKKPYFLLKIKSDKRPNLLP